jgi:hypothetical protein
MGRPVHYNGGICCVKKDVLYCAPGSAHIDAERKPNLYLLMYGCNMGAAFGVILEKSSIALLPYAP